MYNGSCAVRPTSGRKNTTEAEEQFRKILASDPQHAVVLNYLGYTLADREQNLDEALTMISRKPLVLDPANGAYLDSLGWAYYKHRQIRPGGRQFDEGSAEIWQ
jgi:tetratricopeptide (TPR) repeat protein